MKDIDIVQLACVVGGSCPVHNSTNHMVKLAPIIDGQPTAFHVSPGDVATVPKGPFRAGIDAGLESSVFQPADCKGTESYRVESRNKFAPLVRE